MGDEGGCVGVLSSWIPHPIIPCNMQHALSMHRMHCALRIQERTYNSYKMSRICNRVYSSSLAPYDTSDHGDNKWDNRKKKRRRREIGSQE